jgi:hypothetical protein
MAAAAVLSNDVAGAVVGATVATAEVTTDPEAAGSAEPLATGSVIGVGEGAVM